MPIDYEKLDCGESLNRWNLSDPSYRYFPGKARTMPDTVDYQFHNGWVVTGDLPCREAWHEHVASRTLELQDSSCPRVYIGFENPRVEHSCFCFQPTVISRWARCRLRSPVAQRIRLRATTCGGVHIWLGSRRVLLHEPYTRNTPASRSFDVFLEAGENTLTVYADDLHERDTTSFFQLQLLESTGVESGLLTNSNSARLSDVKRMMAGLRFDNLFYSEGLIRIGSDYLPQEPCSLTLHTADPTRYMDSVSKTLLSRHAGQAYAITLSKDSPWAEVVPTRSLESGCPVFNCECQVDDVFIERRLAVSVLCRPVQLHAEELEDRSRLLLRTLVDRGQSDPAYSLVMLQQNRWNDEAQSSFDRLLHIVEQREDCADFHMMTLLWIASEYSAQLSIENLHQLEQAILGFRYWLDEPGNDVMWFWSENHVLCFHVAQYLAGLLFEDRLFPNSAKTGAEHVEMARLRLHRWFDAVEKHGLVEWNSAAYYPIDLRALLTLRSNAVDLNLIQRSGNTIDRIMEMVSLHLIANVPAGSQGRAYEKELFAGPATELGAIASLAFGGLWYPGQDTSAAMLAISGHAVPMALHAYTDVAEGKALRAEYYQGLDYNARLYLWKTADIQLSSVCGHKTGERGHQQHLVDVQFAGHPHARVWVNHPGELLIWGEGRPSYWSGNGVLPRVVQHEDVAIMIYDLPSADLDIEFTHLFCPSDVMDVVMTQHEQWVFAKRDNGYVAVHGNGELEPVMRGLYAGSEWRLHEQTAVWTYFVGNAFAYGSFESFINACLARQPEFDPEQQKLSVLARNMTDCLSLSFFSELRCNDEPVAIQARNSEPVTRVVELRLNV